jgi:signal transduction histidine kinase
MARPGTVTIFRESAIPRETRSGIEGLAMHRRPRPNVDPGVIGPPLLSWHRSCFGATHRGDDRPDHEPAPRARRETSMPDWNVSLALSCRIREESGPEFRELLRGFASELPPHCAHREAYARAERPDHYLLLERWLDARHLAVHLDSDAHRALVGGIRALGTLERVETLHRHELGPEDPGPSPAQLVIHDLKNPLAAIRGLVQLVRDELARTGGLETQVEDLGSANAACEHLQRMIADLLVLTRLGARHLRAVRAPSGVDELVRSVARSYEAVAAARGITIEAQTEPVLASIDAALVRRMIENLVSNAIRHGGSPGRIRLVARTEGGDLRIAVRNTGPAVPDAVLAMLAQGATVARARRGLGLYLCQLVAHAHGGRIVHVAQPEWDVSFEATLPVAEREGSAR